MEDVHMKLNLMGLSIIGMTPMKFNKPLHNVAYKLYSYLTLIYFLFFIVTEYVDLYKKLGTNKWEVMDILGVCLVYMTTIAKLLTVKSNNMPKLLQHIRTTESEIFKSNDEDVKAIYTKHVAWASKLTTFMYSVTVTTYLLFVVRPYLDYLFIGMGDEDFEMTLPFTNWYPFDSQRYYVVAYFLGGLFGFIGSTLTVTTDTFLWGIMIFAIGQIKILQHRLRHFKSYVGNFKDARGIVDDCTAVRMIVGECVVLHKVIIEFVDQLDSSMNLLILVDFLICSIQMGVAGVRIILGDNTLYSQLVSLEFLLAMLVQMAFFYYHANEITLEGDKISGAIWESRWFECTEDVKKSLNFVVFRSQKRLVLKIGPFYPMSIGTALSIVKATYSYVALMRQLYG